MGTRPSVCFRHDAQRPLCRDKLRPVTASRGGALDDPLQLSKNIRCFSKRRRLPSSASSSDSAISERWPVVKRVLNDCTLAKESGPPIRRYAGWLAQDTSEHDSWICNSLAVSFTSTSWRPAQV